MRNYRTIDKTTCNDQSITITKALDPWQYCITNYKADVEANTSSLNRPLKKNFLPTLQVFWNKIFLLIWLNFGRYASVACSIIIFIIILDSLSLQANHLTFPTVYCMAMDYLPIQASAVPCERVFSSSSETDTTKCNRIKLEPFEALQILKFGIKNERLSFTEDLVTSEESMVGAHPSIRNRDLLAGFLDI